MSLVIVLFTPRQSKAHLRNRRDWLTLSLCLIIVIINGVLGPEAQLFKTMKKILFVVASLFSLASLAQSEITVCKNPAVKVSSSARYAVGTEIEALKVLQAEDPSLIGKPVVCRVVETRRSNLSGQEGRLVLRPLYVKADNAPVAVQHDDIYLRGKNRTNVKKWLGTVTIVLAFVPGGGAKMPETAKYTLQLSK